MQLTRILVVAMTLLTSTRGAAHDVRARTDVYVDPWIVVISPAARASVDLDRGARWQLDGSFGVDVLSGATPIFSTDVVTAATEFTETRYGGGAKVAFSPRPEWTVDVSYAVSVEPDHRTHAATVGGSVELFDRMSTLGVSYAFLHEDVGLSFDRSYEQLTLGHRVDASWTQILARRSVLSILATTDFTDCDPELGCQANPYRFVAILGPTAGDPVTAITPERHPKRRVRGAGSLRYIQGFNHGLAVHTGYRYYRDTWRVDGHTVDLGLAKSSFSGRLLARITARGTLQSAAAFFRDDYRQPAGTPFVPRHRTGDLELSPSTNLMASGRAEYRPFLRAPVRLSVSARLAHIWYRYAATERPRRNAWIAGAGLGGTF